MTFYFSFLTINKKTIRKLIYLLNVNKLERRLPRNRILRRNAFLLLPSPQHLSRLPTLINSNDLNLLGTSDPQQTTHHLREDGEFVKGQLAVKDCLGLLLTLHQTLLQALHEGHGLLHLAEFAYLGVQVFVVEGDGDGVEGLADKIDVLLLPCGELLSCVDCDLLGLAGVEAKSLALGELLGESCFGRSDVGGGGADVVGCSREFGGRLRDLREEGVVDGFRLFNTKKLVLIHDSRDKEILTFLRTSRQMYSVQ